MDIEDLQYFILRDAVKEDLLPTALISRYDVTLDRLMHGLRTLLDDRCLALTEGKWIRITDRGRQIVKEREEEKIREIEEWKSNYVEEFFSREDTVEVNVPYMPSADGLKSIMEGVGLKETSNKK